MEQLAIRDAGHLPTEDLVANWGEAIFDAIKRKPDPKTGKVPLVGNTVDIKSATYTNSIGDSQLTAVWTDPDVYPTQHAVYYVRVLEIPTPRWSTNDAKALGIEPLEDVPATIQERAWSSPIWYTPAPNLVKKQDWYYGLQQTLP